MFYNKIQHTNKTSFLISRLRPFAELLSLRMPMKQGQLKVFIAIFFIARQDLRWLALLPHSEKVQGLDPGPPSLSVWG